MQRPVSNLEKHKMASRKALLVRRYYVTFTMAIEAGKQRKNVYAFKVLFNCVPPTRGYQTRARVPFSGAQYGRFICMLCSR